MFLRFFEAPVGFEPTNKGFADLRLEPLGYSALTETQFLPEIGPFVSGKRDSNPRHQPWQGCALPTELFPHFSVLKTVTNIIVNNHSCKKQNLIYYLYLRVPRIKPL